MNRRSIFLSFVLSLVCVSCAFAGEVLSVKVTVRLRDKPEDRVGRPFVGVGGFVMKRTAAEYKGASCPNASNGKGDLDCKVTCEKADADLQLLVFSPTKEKARIVAGVMTRADFESPVHPIRG